MQRKSCKGRPGNVSSCPKPNCHPERKVPESCWSLKKIFWQVKIYTIKGTHHLNEETGKTGKDKHWAYKAGLCYLEYGQIVFRACILTKNVLWASILNLFDVDYWSKTSQILKKSITKTCRDTWYTITTRYTLVFLSRLVEDLSLFLWKMSWWEKENIGNGSSCPPCPPSPPNLRKESLRTLLCSSFPFVVVSSFYPYPLHYGPIPIKKLH